MVITEVFFRKVTAWPVECAECEYTTVLHSHIEAAIHQQETQHERASVPVPEDSPSQRLMEAANQWTSAECVDCAAQFTNQSEAFEHERIFPAHSVLHLSSARPVN